MLQNPCKTLGFKKNMVYEIPPGGEVNHIQPVAYLLRKPITHIHLFEKSINILISTGSGWGARRLDIGLNLHHQALLLLCVCKCEKRRLRRNAF